MTLARAIHINVHRTSKRVTMTSLWICDGGQVSGLGFVAEYATDTKLMAKRQTPSHIVMPLVGCTRRCPSAISRGNSLSGNTEDQKTFFRIWISEITRLGEIVQTPGQIAAGTAVRKQRELANSGVLMQGGISCTAMPGRSGRKDSGEQ